MSLSFGIGAVKKKSAARGRKKTTASKTKKVVAKKKGAKPTAGSKVSASGKRYYPSTPKAKKTYTASLTCSKAGTELKRTGSTRAGAILALCKASVQNNNIKKSTLSKYRVQARRLSSK